MKPKIKYLSAYIKTRHYGGAEEGGWCYNNYELIASIKVKVKGIFIENMNRVVYWESNTIKSHRKKLNAFLNSLDESERENIYVEDFKGQYQDIGAHYYE